MGVPGDKGIRTTQTALLCTETWKLMRFKFITISVLIGKKTPEHTQFYQISTSMEMPKNPAKYEVLIINNTCVFNPDIVQISF